MKTAAFFLKYRIGRSVLHHEEDGEIYKKLLCSR